MTVKNYQRRHLRAPLKETLLYADGSHVLKARTLNISEGGFLIDQLPSFPENEVISMMVSLPQIPYLKNFNLLKLQTFSKELFKRHVIRAQGKVVRKEELSQNLDNLFRSRFGIEFVEINPQDRKYIEEYITAYSSNLIYLQTLIDSWSSDEETKIKTRTLAGILGYSAEEKIAQLRSKVFHDYKSLQWL